MRTGRFVHIPFRSDLSREDELALEAATEWILAEIENSVFARTLRPGEGEVSVSEMRRVAEKELHRPRDATHRRWAELFIRETNEIEFDHVRPEIRKLVARGDVTVEEYMVLRCNSYERELLIPTLNDEALAMSMQHTLENCSLGTRPFSTYNEAVCGLYGPELLKRFQSASRAARDYAQTIDNVRESLGQKATHYLITADDVKELVEAIEKHGGPEAREALSRIRENNDLRGASVGVHVFPDEVGFSQIVMGENGEATVVPRKPK